MADVFLSYASEDRERVTPLVEALQTASFSVWWDRRIGIGSSFDREIERELSLAKCVVTVWSDASVDSDWVRAESQEGLDRSILVPVCIDDVKPPLAFRRVQTADLSSFDSQVLDAFLQAVGRVTSIKPVSANTVEISNVPIHKDSRAKLAMSAVLALAVVAVAGIWWWTTRIEIPAPVAVKMVTPLRSVVVMPFENQGSDLDSATLDALHADVIRYMGRDGYLKMIGRTTARRLQSRGESLTTIAVETDASHVVEVTLRSEESSTKVSLNLVRTDTKNSVWGPPKNYRPVRRGRYLYSQ